MTGNTTLEGFYPSYVEIVLPSILFLVVSAAGMLHLIFNKNRKCGWQSEVDVLESLHLFVNTPKEILVIYLPAMLSLAFFPLTFFIHEPVVELFWPKHLFPEHPDVNDGIACFLVPAGMVYAITFGFTLQQVMAKQQSTDMYVGQEVDRLHRLLTMVSKLKLNSMSTKLQIYHIIKNETIKFIVDILDLQDTDLSPKMPDFMDILFLICEDDVGWNEKYNSTVKEPITNLVTNMPYAVGSRSPCKQRIHILQWAFLETLGYFTFLGILLVVGYSYRIELSMCIITVVSITMLCYIIADMDSPFHGYFRTDLSIIQDLATRLEQLCAEEEPKQKLQLVVEN